MGLSSSLHALSVYTGWFTITVKNYRSILASSRRDFRFTFGVESAKCSPLALEKGRIDFHGELKHYAWHKGNDQKFASTLADPTAGRLSTKLRKWQFLRFGTIFVISCQNAGFSLLASSHKSLFLSMDDTTIPPSPPGPSSRTKDCSHPRRIFGPFIDALFGNVFSYIVFSA